MDDTAPAPQAGPAPATPVSYDRRHSWVPLSAEPMARGIVDFLGGPAGRFARPRPHWMTPTRAVTAVAWVFLALGFLAKANCAGGVRDEHGAVHLNWSGNRHYTSACYNDIVPLFAGRGLDQGGFPYAFSWVEDGVNRYMEYPVLAGLFQGAIAAVARATHPLVVWVGIPAAGWYFALTALTMSILWVAAITLVMRLVGNRFWDTLLIAASPLVIVHAFTNWDIPSIFCMVAAVFAFQRSRPGWAGFWIGIGTAVKLWPLYILGAYLVLAIRMKSWRPFSLMLGTAAVTWLAVNLPVALAYPAAWGEFFRLNSERSWEWTTVYALLARNTAFNLSPGVLNALSFGLFAALCLAILVVGLKASRTPRVGELIFLIVAAFLLVNKVWSPQYSLWLLIPAVLAVPRWRLITAWAWAEFAVWPLLMWHMLGTENGGIPHELLDAAILVRDGLIIAMVVLVLRQMRGRADDAVRRSHPDRPYSDPLQPVH